MSDFTNAQFLTGIAAGNVYSYRGRLLRVAGDVPSDAQIAIDAALDATNAPPLLGAANTWAARQNIKVADAGTTNNVIALAVGHNTTGVPAAGFGTNVRLQAQDVAGPDSDLAQFLATWTDPAHATKTANLALSVAAAGALVGLVTLKGVGTTVINGITNGQSPNVLEVYKAPADTLLQFIDPTGVLTTRVVDATTGGIAPLVVADHRTSGTPVAGFGGSEVFALQSTTTAGRTGASLAASWIDPTDATRQARLQLFANDTAAREGLRIDASGTAALIGFYGHAAAAQPTVTGSRGSNAALASLLTALASQGLVVDGSS